jgi:hypothetical protein
MKKNIYFLLIFSFLAWSCKKDADEEALQIFSPGDIKNGVAIGTKTTGNSQKGTVTMGGAAVLDHLVPRRAFIISIGATSEFNEARESIYIAYIPIQEGTFTIEKPNSVNNEERLIGSYARLFADGDVLDGTYWLDSDKKNDVTVTQIDTVARTVEGVFNVHFSLYEDGITPKLPKQVSFTNMKFDLKLIKK